MAGMRALAPAIVALLLLTGCSSAAPATPTRTPLPSPAASSPATAAPVATAAATPTAEPRPEHETTYLAAIDAALGPDWRDTYEYMGAEGQDEHWLDMGYAVCGMLAADLSREQTLGAIEPTYVNPRLYAPGFAEVLVDAARPLCL